MFGNDVRVAHVDGADNDQTRLYAFDALDRVKDFHSAFIVDGLRPLRSSFSSRARREDDHIRLGESLREVCDRRALKREEKGIDIRRGSLQLFNMLGRADDRSDGVRSRLRQQLRKTKRDLRYARLISTRARCPMHNSCTFPRPPTMVTLVRGDIGEVRVQGEDAERHTSFEGFISSQRHTS